LVTGGISLAAPQNYDWKDLREKTDAMMIEADDGAHLDADGDESEEALTKVFRLACITACGMTLIMIFLWPALALPAEVFNPGYFGWWVAIAFIWAHFAFCVTVLLPIYEFVFPATGYDRWGNKIIEPNAPVELKQGATLQEEVPPTGFYMPPPEYAAAPQQQYQQQNAAAPQVQYQQQYAVLPAIPPYQAGAAPVYGQNYAVGFA